MSRRRAWLIGVGLAGAVTVGVALLRPEPLPPPGPEPGRTLFALHCATCHGADGRGATWRARLLWLRPGDLGSREAARLSDEYLHDVVRHGGASLGKPGMPSFGFVLTDEEIRAVTRYVRALGGERP